MAGGGFDALLNTASTGDAAERDRAYTELLRFVRIVVRAEMGRKLRDHRESADVCQSIAKSFVSDLQNGRLAFDNEHALAAFLRLAVRNKLAELARHDGALKRGGGERNLQLDGMNEPADTESDSISINDWPRLRSQLDAVERRLVELQMRGLTWARIGEELDMTAPAARKKFSRVLKRLRENEADNHIR